MGFFDSLFSSDTVNTIADVAAIAAAPETGGASLAMSPGMWSAAGDIGSSLISGGLSYMGQSSANQANAAEAQKNRDFQERMRSTQYQTAVKDMMAAGLNPMLAYQQGGSGTPSGAVPAAMQNTFGEASKQIGGSVGRGIQAAATMAQIKNLDEQNKQIQATTAREMATTAAQSSQADLNKAQTLKVDQDILINAALQVLYQRQAANTSALTGKIGAVTQGIRYENVGKGAESRMYGRPGGEAIPYGKALLPAVSSAVGGATIGSILGGKIKFGRKPQ